METKTITIEGSETGDEQKAKEQLLKIRANPRNATTVEVIDAYDTQRNEVADVLDHKIAETKYGCHYQVYHDPNASIGHKYFRPHIIKSGQTVDTYEDDLGA
ncbi:MAG: hypothetical protein MJ201_01810 [Mycoplasmoidaceae bacterium]|nr:hypothetical protein [Mycoplasmoidaceae bacterium]